ncbi:MAG TPA: hypothetical protein VNJ28_02975 [Candidatus Limnocylindrales bacterium]|jgi:hypothetical protein|nr:hypothetical protein [Candidatus Limnocylindrales bacterium]
MAEYVRQCAKCGNVDRSMTWSSVDEAASRGAFQQSWTCPQCAWPDFDIVEASEAAGMAGARGAGRAEGETES